jgi:hypothetical protein
MSWVSQKDEILKLYLRTFNQQKKLANFNNLQAFLSVGAAGFEPAAPWSQTRCATGLRYAPNFNYWERKDILYIIISTLDRKNF